MPVPGLFLLGLQRIKGFVSILSYINRTIIIIIIILHTTDVTSAAVHTPNVRFGCPRPRRSTTLKLTHNVNLRQILLNSSALTLHNKMENNVKVCITFLDQNDILFNVFVYSC